MISVVIPTFDSAETLPMTLAGLVAAAVDGLVREVIVADAGSNDATLAIADDVGATVVPAEPRLAAQLGRACASAKSDWLLILSPGVHLQPGWETAAKAHIAGSPQRAGYFRLAVAQDGVRARLRELGSRIARLLGRAPSAEQGLLITRAELEEQLGGEAMTSTSDIVRRLARRHALVRLRANVTVT